jgi:hypothetical protein
MTLQPTAVEELVHLVRLYLPDWPSVADPVFDKDEIAMKRDLTEAQLELIWRYSILPQLQEYYIEETGKAEAWEWDGDILRAIRGAGRWRGGWWRSWKGVGLNLYAATIAHRSSDSRAKAR